MRLLTNAFAARVFPRESKKLQTSTMAGLSVLLTQELAELSMLQLAQYLGHCDAQTALGSGARHLLCPLAVGNLHTAGEKVEEEEDEAEEEEEGRLPSDDDSSQADNQPAKSRGVAALCDKRLLAFPPTLSSVGALLSTKHFRLPWSLALEWTRQLFLAADHLVSW